MQKFKNSHLLQQNGISALSFSKNGAYCAIATKANTRVYIFQIKTFNDINSWLILQEITDHTQTVSEIDWSIDQKILTVSHDRSIFVWKKNAKKWDKMMVNIDAKLSVMACKWAPSCKKFAIGACPNTLIIGYYNVEVNCWTAIVKDNIVKAPIVSLDFHPSSNIVAIGSVDGSVKIVSCNFRKHTDEFIIRSKVDDFPYSGPFQKIDTLNEVLFSIQNILPNMNVWINHVSFQNNGKNLLVLTHSNHLKFYEVTEGQNILVNEKDVCYKNLPFINGLFNQEKQQLVLAGFDRKVFVYTKSGDGFKFQRHLDRNEKTDLNKSKGLVQSMLKGIQKKQWTFGDHPRPQQHVNIAKVTRTRGKYVSYDINGVVHFWE